MKKILLLFLTIQAGLFAMQKDDSAKLMNLFKKINTVNGTIKNKPAGWVKDIFVLHVMPFFPLNDEWINCGRKSYCLGQLRKATEANISFIMRLCQKTYTLFVGESIKVQETWSEFFLKLIKEAHLSIYVIYGGTDDESELRKLGLKIWKTTNFTEKNLNVLQAICKNIHIEVGNGYFKNLKIFENYVSSISLSNDGVASLNDFVGCKNISAITLQEGILSAKDLKWICDSCGKKLNYLELNQVKIQNEALDIKMGFPKLKELRISCLPLPILVGLCLSARETLVSLYIFPVFIYSIEKNKELFTNLKELKRLRELSLAGVEKGFLKKAEEVFPKEFRDHIKKLALIVVVPYPKIPFKEANKVFASVSKENYYSSN